ncbi:lytic transglycosylase domain-containing protein [Ectopseudomonas guguanensis]|uniref:lytic transglycosylase domain-containing protein n=1 Tax=Ectopseudomonas guguanensis TaxID=1198456 RepID=UPI0012D505A5|nr:MULTISPECIES: transglycosylase SLT domain-containing protein [Pseudomonas]MPT20216.1 lytic transglycosylase [Pseudomonas sp.]WJH54791.1 lytic transglycosylase [Pseudomonas guguanensis]
MSIVSLAQHMNSHRGTADGISTAREQQLQAAAEQFEALFLQQILKQMRKASDVLAEGNPMRSRELDTMRDFYDEVLAETLAGRKQTGIADMLVKQLSGSASQTPDLEAAAAAARAAELPSRSGSLLEPLRSTWQRGVESLGQVWDKGAVGFLALVERVIQQESAGRVDAVSPKGARGLMQLMPDTAREMAAELGLPFDEARLTSDAAYNRRLGSAYLDKMLQRYDGHQALALAAYNAGPGRVDEWLKVHGDPRRGEIATGAWIERIPFQETRDYTRKILGDLAKTEAAPAPARDAQASSPLSAQTRQQLASALSADSGLLLGAVAGKQALVRSEFKSAADSVALSSVTAQSAADDARAPRLAAFAQPMRFERQES